jgi:hypothetical protein
LNRSVDSSLGVDLHPQAMSDEPQSLINLGGNNVLPVTPSRWDSDLPGKGVPTTVKNQYDYMGVMNKEVTARKWVSVETPREEATAEKMRRASESSASEETQRCGGVGGVGSVGGGSDGSNGGSGEEGSSNQTSNEDDAKQTAQGSTGGDSKDYEANNDPSQKKFVARTVAKGLELSAQTKYQASLGLSIADSSQIKAANDQNRRDSKEEDPGDDVGDGAEPKKKWNPFPKEWVEKQDEIKKD